jgi:GntR family transcriptional regulator
MILRINFQSDIPIYEQIRRAVIEGIGTGRLVSGESLPSVRQLAADLGINLHTVNKAYSMLKDEGFVQVHRKRGVIINPDKTPGATQAYMTTLRGNIFPIVVEAFSRGVSETEFVSMCREVYKDLAKRKKEA